MRSRCIALAAIAGVSPALAKDTSTSCPVLDFDVVVVGAGLSGLSAAKDLIAAGKSVHIVEARDRVGGRVLNGYLKNGGVTELGAEFVGPTQDRVLDLISNLGLQAYDIYEEGNSTFYQNGVQQTYYQVPPVEPESLFEYSVVEETLNAMAATIDVAKPWAHPNATQWDGLTFETWLDNMITLPDARFLFDTVSAIIFSAGPQELSLLYVVSYIASAGNQTTAGTLQRLTGTAGAAQAQRLKGGTQLIAVKLAERLGLDKITFNSPVRRIAKNRDRYVIKANGVTLRASSVVVAMSPPLAARISYYPLLPANRDQLTQRMPMASIAKAIAIYSTPFWRENGQNAQAIGDSGVSRTTFDNSPSDGSFGAIMGFIEADVIRALDGSSEEEVKSLVLKNFVNYYGPQAANVTEFLLQRWDNEEFSRGGPVAIAPPGVLTQFGPALTAPFEGIHFAGTESADYWVGYMDGAIRSGERAAKEILNV